VCSCAGSCDKCQVEQGDALVQMKRAGFRRFRPDHSPAQRTRKSLRSPGQPLDAATRAAFHGARASGRDFFPSAGALRCGRRAIGAGR